MALALLGCAPPQRPNVVFVLVDALRADRLGCYGHSSGLTPKIDDLSTTSLLFERAFSNAPSTVRSVASIFTSTLPFVHRLSQPPGGALEQSVLADRLILMPEILQDHGYHTTMITTSGWITPEVNYDQGVDEYIVESRADAHLLAAALEALQRRVVDDRRFFLYLHLLDLHDYYHSSRLFADGDGHASTVSERFLALRDRSPSEIYSALREEPESFTPEDAAFLLAAYDRELLKTDRTIGALVNGLGDLGLLDDTLLILASDHGEQFLEHGHLVHGGDGFFNEVLHIPLIFSSPGLFTTRVTISAPTGSIDILPTLLDILGIESPEELQGRSMRPPVPDDNTVLATNERTWKVLTRDWSYIFSRRYRREELYDLRHDSSESRNLVEEKSEIVRGFRALLAETIQRSGRHPYQSEIGNPATVGMSPQVEKTLRSLGYLE